MEYSISSFLSPVDREQDWQPYQVDAQSVESDGYYTNTNNLSWRQNRMHTAQDQRIAEQSSTL